MNSNQFFELEHASEAFLTCFLKQRAAIKEAVETTLKEFAEFAIPIRQTKMMNDYQFPKEFRWILQWNETEISLDPEMGLVAIAQYHQDADDSRSEYTEELKRLKLDIQFFEPHLRQEMLNEWKSKVQEQVIDFEQERKDIIKRHIASLSEQIEHLKEKLNK